MNRQQQLAAARREFAMLVAANPGAGPRKLSRLSGLPYTTTHDWLRREVPAAPPRAPEGARFYVHTDKRTQEPRMLLDVQGGDVVVFSDAHFWPGVRTAAFRAVLQLIRDLRPRAVIANGDVFDGVSISRWPRIGWESRPTVAEELRACVDRMGEIEDVAGRAKLLWTLGNHDQRYNSALSAKSPEFEGIQGFSLADHFPAWKLGWGVWINDDAVVKHRWRGGVHAARNNALNSGRTIITGHLHSLKVTPVTDYNGTRYGVDTGTLADPLGPQFENYTETGPTDWRSGFAVLTYHKGRLLWPQIAHAVSDTEVEFGREVIRV